MIPDLSMRGSIGDVQSRVADIRARFQAPVSRVGSAAPASSSGAMFAATLASIADPSTAGPSGFPALFDPALASGSVAPGAARITPPLAAPSASPGTATASAEAVIAGARRQLGVPYVWGGTTPAGFDCSGFLQYVFRDVGVELPRVSRDQARAGRPVASLAEARPGDLVAFGSPVDHIGLYLGDGKMIAAPRRGDVVKVQDVYKTPTAIRRVLPDAPAAAGAAGLVAPTTTGAPAGALGPVGGAPAAPTSFDALFAAAGARHGISPAVLAAVAKAESGGNPRAVSRAGAQGLMQLMPATAAGLGVDPFDPAQAVDGAARLLKDHLGRFGSLELALAAYNAGPGAVTRHGGVPPYAETKGYVRKILADLGGVA